MSALTLPSQSDSGVTIQQEAVAFRRWEQGKETSGLGEAEAWPAPVTGSSSTAQGPCTPQVAETNRNSRVGWESLLVSSQVAVEPAGQACRAPA